MSSSASQPGGPRVRPRQSLSARLWLLTTLVVLASEIVVFFPDVARERHNWLLDRVEDAHVAAAAAASAGNTGEVGARHELLHLFGVEAIRVTEPGSPAVAFGTSATPTAMVDLRDEGLFTGIRRALAAIVSSDDRLVRLAAESPFRPGTEVELVFHQQALSETLRRFTDGFIGLSLLIAGVTGWLVYLALLMFLVRPMRRITGSIAAFRADPERTVPLDPDDVSVLPNDEITVASRELAAMQHELRNALWRNARLAALGTMVAKVSHDLRGILSPAMLTAERLQTHADPKVQRAGEILVRTVERATELVRRALDYAREGPPPPVLTTVALAKLVDETGDAVRVQTGALVVDNRIEPGLKAKADHGQLFRVLFNLLRNAAEAGAHSVRVLASQSGTTLSIEIADDGPGLPEAVLSNLFRPFAGSVRRGGTGLGLAIARDLMLAHGGDIELAETGRSGTTFRLTLRAEEVENAAASARPVEQEAGVQPPSSAQIAPAAPMDV